MGHAVSCLRHELNVDPAFLKASVSAQHSSLNCVHISSAILGDQERQYQERQREISVWMTASASYWQDRPGWEIKGCRSWIKLWYFRRMTKTAVSLCNDLDFSFFSYILQIFKSQFFSNSTRSVFLSFYLFLKCSHPYEGTRQSSLKFSFSKAFQHFELYSLRAEMKTP